MSARIASDPIERFWSKVEQVGDCWIWRGALSGRSAYGRFTVRRGLVVGAHRWAYEYLRADIPEGLHIDHLCKVRTCVNPWHMEPVTMAVNNLRSDSPWAKNARKTHCVNGHEFTPENTSIYAKTGARHCRQCVDIRNRRHRAKRREARRMTQHEQPTLPGSEDWGVAA